MQKLLISLILFLTACGLSHQVTTDTLAAPSISHQGFPPGTTFSITTNNSLLAKQLAHKIEQALTHRGYTISDQGRYQLTFQHRITPHKVTINKTEYSPQKTENKKGFIKDDEGKVSYKETTKTSLEWKTVPTEETHYERELTIHIFDGPQEIWNGTAKNTSNKADIREALDYLLHPLLNFFGRDTQKSLTTKVHEKDLLIP